MANTYTQINIHTIFSVQGRKNLLKNNKQFPLAINGFTDHVHIFFELHPTTAISDILRIVKTNSSKWINENHFINDHFSWQEGYGAFSYSHSQSNNVIKYIINQKKHHSKKSFKNEYLELLKKFKIEFYE